MVNTLSESLKWLFAAAIAVLTIRLISLGFYPLYDTTEARYGEIARLMLETGNWVTPQFDYDIPFWGKPPFQTWISAASFSLFGINEFAARLPHFLCSIATLLMVYSFVKEVANKKRAVYSAIIMISSIGFTVTAGTVMTDSALLMATTLAMISFWRCYQQHNSKINGLLFFAALSLGMLIKGPVAVVLIGIALVCWSLYQRCFVKAICCLPWLAGICVFLVLTLPWYIWAEIRSPGFLEYFIVGEHIQRFLVSGWQGDLYGTAHKEPRGMIWLFWIGAAFPWSLFLISQGIKRVFGKAKTNNVNTKLTSYLLCWMLSPLLLFSLSGNILPAYVLPGMAAMAMIVALSIHSERWLTFMASVAYGLLVTFIAWVCLGNISKTSEKSLLEGNMSRIDGSALYYWKKRPFSAQFYSHGQAKKLTQKSKLRQLLAGKDEFYLAITHTDIKTLDTNLSNSCQSIMRNRKHQLYHCHSKGTE